MVGKESGISKLYKTLNAFFLYRIVFS